MSWLAAMSLIIIPFLSGDINGDVIIHHSVADFARLDRCCFSQLIDFLLPNSSLNVPAWFGLI